MCIHILKLSLVGAKVYALIQPTQEVNLCGDDRIEPEWQNLLQRMKVGVGSVTHGTYKMIEASKISRLCVFKEVPAKAVGNICALVLWHPLSLNVPELDPMEEIAMYLS